MRRVGNVVMAVVLSVVADRVAPVSEGTPSPVEPLFPTRLRHVAVIVYENSQAGNVIAHGPFFQFLA